MSAAKDVLKVAAMAIDGLDVIQGLTGFGGAKADAALDAIAKVVQALKDGFAGNTTPDIVASELAVLKHALSANDEEADRRVDARFPKE